jgi:hypothetical protein
MTSRASRRARVKYFFDQLFSKGTPVLVGWLLVSTIAAVMVIAVISYLTGESGSSLPRLMWEGLQRMFDPGGIVSSADPSDSATFKATMIATSVVGVIALACLIGLVTTELEKVFANLRRGRSRVVERGHTLILGWSRHVPMVVREIAIANGNHRGRSIVILAERDPVELRETLVDEIGSTRRTRVIFRRGDPTNFNDLDTVDFSGARAIIIVPNDLAYSDSLEIKTLLAVINHPRRKPQHYHVVASLSDPSNAAVAKMVAGDEVEVVVFHDVAARIVAQTCCQPGLSAVYTELLDFGGDEIYFKEEPRLAGKTFAESLLCYEDSAVIGLRPRGGMPLLWPPFDTVIGPGDEIIAISSDDDTVRLATCTPAIQEEAILASASRKKAPQRTLILGWSPPMPTIIRELDAYVAPGSTVTVLAPSDEVESMVKTLSTEMSHQTLATALGLHYDRETLNTLDIPSYEHVIVGGTDSPDPQEADAQALLALLHLRDIGRISGAKFSVVTEMRDARDRELATVAKADDFVVSEHLLGLLLAQIAENKHLKPIFDDLFDPEGAEIYLKPATDYVQAGRAVDFYTVVEAARRRNEIAIGYRLVNGRAQTDGADCSGLGYGIVVNPPKSGLLAFEDDDCLIVIGEN